MIIVVSTAGIVGGALTAILLSSYGWLAALFLAPLGGSSAAALVAALVAFRADRGKPPLARTSRATKSAATLVLLLAGSCQSHREPFFTGFEQRMPFLYKGDCC